MTLTEMLVASAVLSMMILMVGNLLAQSRQTVKASQVAIRANAEFRAFADQFRNDMAHVSADGFLGIMYTPDTKPGATVIPGQPRLVFTAVGNYASLYDPGLSANAARIDYGMTYTTSTNASGPITRLDPKIFWRRAILLVPPATVGIGKTPLTVNSDNPPPTVAQRPLLAGNNAVIVADVIQNASLAMFRTYQFPQTPRSVLAVSNSNTNSNWSTLYGAVTPQPFDPASPDIQTRVTDGKLPVGTVLAAQNLWPVALRNVTLAKIQWTDGQVNAAGRLSWYDRDNPRDPPSTSSPTATDGWMGKVALSQDPINAGDVGMDYPEFSGKMGLPAYPNNYMALWTFRKKDAWPKAIRVQVIAGGSGQTYEVIADLPQ
jgi:type II secretory pathway pseudopilin PulG